MLALRLQRLYISQASRRQTRFICSSRVNNGMMDYLNFYKRKQKENELKVKSTDDLITELENNSELKSNEDIDNEIESAEQIEILGKYDPQFYNQELIAEQLEADGFTVSKWIQEDTPYSESISQLESTDFGAYRPVVDKLLTDLSVQYYDPELKGLSSDELNEVQLSNLMKRFDFLKRVQMDFGVTIDDYQLTQMNTLGKLRNFLYTELNPEKIVRNEKLPNAIYLRPQDYEGTNVYIQDHVFKTEKEKNRKKLLEDAMKAEDNAFAKLTEA